MKPLKVFSINALAVEIGRDRRTITAALRGVAPDGVTDGGYDGWTVRTAMAALALRGAGLGPELQRARLDAARADLAEFALAQKTAGLVPAEQIDQAWTAITGAIRDRVLMIPGLAAARIDPSRPVTEIESHIRHEIDAALNAISGADVVQDADSEAHP